LTVRPIDEVGQTCGLEPGGAILVRPDGVVAWRTASLPDDPADALRAACDLALGRVVNDGATRAAEAA
jgi:hypothetical protein